MTLRSHARRHPLRCLPRGEIISEWASTTPSKRALAARRTPGKRPQAPPMSPHEGART